MKLMFSSIGQTSVVVVLVEVVVVVGRIVVVVVVEVVLVAVAVDSLINTDDSMAISGLTFGNIVSTMMLSDSSSPP